LNSYLEKFQGKGSARGPRRPVRGKETSSGGNNAAVIEGPVMAEAVEGYRRSRVFKIEGKEEEKK